ncbi:MAG: dephospho-CoA kinase [bacterium]
MAAKIGLTGGIGSGKSSVAGLFKQLGVEVIDADSIARDITKPGSLAFDEIVQRFSHRVLLPDGRLDRKSLGEVVFSDEDQRRWLEALLHPEIRRQMDQRASECPDPYCVLEIPLLQESGRYRDMARTIVVHCPQDIRIERLKISRAMPSTVAENIMNNQASDEERLAIADFVIDNSGDLNDLDAQVVKIHNLLLQQYDAC